MKHFKSIILLGQFVLFALLMPYALPVPSQQSYPQNIFNYVQTILVFTMLAWSFGSLGWWLHEKYSIWSLKQNYEELSYHLENMKPGKEK